MGIAFMSFMGIKLESDQKPEDDTDNNEEIMKNK